ncbi:MAG: DUF3108 domain-containing protein [Thiotrichaceae bacterium]
MKIKLILLSLVLSLTSVGAIALPAAFNATYSVSKSGLTLGEMKSSLSYNGTTYKYHKKSISTGLVSWLSGDKVSENADGKFNGNYLQSVNYLYHHTSKRKNRKDQLKFISPREVKGVYKSNAYNLKVPNGSLDRATLELALARDLAANKKVLKYSIVERGHRKDYLLQRQGTEKLTIKNKQYNAEKLIVVRKGTTRKTTFWLAKELDYMPVKINHVEKGDAIVTELKSFKFLKEE